MAILILCSDRWSDYRGKERWGTQQTRLSKHKSSGWTSENSPYSLKTNSGQNAGTAQRYLYNINLVNKLEDAVIILSLISLKIKLDFEKGALIFPVLCHITFLLGLWRC